MATTEVDSATTAEEELAAELAYWEAYEPVNDLERELVAFKIRQIKRGEKLLSPEELQEHIDELRQRD